MLISNFVYEKQGASRKKVMQYRRCLPVNEIFGWDSVHMSKGKYLLMHSIIYRTKLLHECGLELPKHTFYVDNLFAFEPLPFVKNMYYLDVNFYRYFIGRDDQSVNEKVMIKRIDQQIRVNKLMADAFHNCQFDSKHLKKYMLSYLDIITTVSSIMLVRAGTQEALDKKKEMLEYIREQDLWLYHKLRYSILGRAANLPGRGGRKMFVAAYKVCQKFYWIQLKNFPFMGKFLRCRNYFYEIILICFGSIHTEKSCKRPADSPSLCTASLASLWISIFFTAKNVDTIEMCMFSEESSRKTTYYFGFAQTVYNDHIQIAVGRTGIGTEFESTAFVFLIHDGSKIYFGKLFFFIVIHEQCHRRWLQEKQLFQCDKEIDQFAEADFVQDFFHRSDANFMAYRCVKTDSTADRETTAAGTTGNMRNVPSDVDVYRKESVRVPS